MIGRSSPCRGSACAVCVFSTQLGQHVDLRFLTGISYLKKAPAMYTSNLLKFVLGRHKFSMTTACLSTYRVWIPQRSMSFTFSTRTLSYWNDSADLAVLSLVSQVPGFKSCRQSGVNFSDLQKYWACSTTAVCQCDRVRMGLFRSTCTWYRT